MPCMNLIGWPWVEAWRIRISAHWLTGKLMARQIRILAVAIQQGRMGYSTNRVPIQVDCLERRIDIRRTGRDFVGVC